MINEIMIIDKTEAPRVCMICMDANNGDMIGLIVKNNPNVSTFHSVHKACFDKLIIAHSNYNNREKVIGGDEKN
jgi:hypothetical protein